MPVRDTPVIFLHRCLRVIEFLLLFLSLAIRPDPGFAPPPPSEVEMVKARLAPLQHLSFAARYEYCGYLGLSRGQLTFTDMVRGGHNGCTPVMPGNGFRRVASLHTHGAYDPSVPAEFPTVLDMQSDRREGVNGYVATPGGRLWYIDSRAMVAVQLCGLACLPQDPAFHAGDDGKIATRYSLRELKRLESGE